MQEGANAAPLGRLIRIAGMAIAALLAIISSPASAREPQRIVAVGDLHGDFSAWTDIARGAGLIDPGGHWAGGRTILVQLGDVVDRGGASLRIIRNLQQLQKEAPRAGGKVVLLLGNHEAMNLLGDYRYTTPEEFAAFANAGSAALRDKIYDANRPALEAAARAKDPAVTPEQVRAAWIKETPLGWVEHKIAWSPSGELGKWAGSHPAIARIDGTLFVHGGLSAEYAQLPIADINRRVAAAMAAADDSAASILDDPLGPLWYRGLVIGDPDAEAVRAARNPPSPNLTAEQELGAVLAAYDAKRLVVAHTPDLKGIEILYGGRLARIDTGDSRYYGGPPSWLEIVGGVMTPHQVPRATP
jgi:calcineurin-like phosphoesterase family protein